jgi:hypothetical protein
VNTTGIEVGGSGSSGNPITIKADTGGSVNITCGAWAAGIDCLSHNYIIVDGSNNMMTIQNTANGTGLANSITSGLINFNYFDHSEIKNTNELNTFVKTGNGTDGQSDFGVNLLEITTGSVHGVTSTWSNICINVNYLSGANGIQVYDNSVNNCAWGYGLGTETGADNGTNISIYGNSAGPNFDDYLDTGGSVFHGNGLVLNSCCNTSPLPIMSNVSVYNNYFHGDLSSGVNLNSTGYVTLFGGFSNVNIFNNILGQDVAINGSPEGMIRVSFGGAGFGSVSPNVSNMAVYNNTMYCITNCSAGIKTDFGGSTAGFLTAENNIFYQIYWPILDDQCPSGSPSCSAFGEFSTINHNDYYGGHGIATAQGGLSITSFSTWQGSPYNHEANGSNGNPNLYSSAPPWYITSGSAASGLGANLTSLSIAALDADAPYTFGTGYACGSGCTARPSSGAWPAGAYQVNGTPPPTPIPPAPAPQMFVWTGTVKAPVTVTLSGSTVVSPLAFAGTESRKISCTCIVPVTGKMGCACK